jgi:general stress protein 26
MSLTWAPGVAMSKEEIDSFLNEKLISRFTSIRPDGYPHTTPLWYVWDSEALWFVVGAGVRPRQHIRNLQQNPKMSAIIDRDARPTEGGSYNAQGVTVRGIAELTTDVGVQDDVSRKILMRYFGGVSDENVRAVLEDGKPGNNRVIVKVRPEKLYAWDLLKMEGGGYLDQ